jgi:PKD repeat protein
LAVLAATLLSVVTLPDRLAAQSFRWGGTEFNALRKVNIPSDARYAIVVTQFFHHGEIAPDGKNVIVLTQDRKPVATRILQLGPGDYCRLAFETLALQRNYEIYYGGNPPSPDQVPGWKSTAGLLLETREYRECNLNSLDSVRDAYQSAARIGSDYVDAVHHSYNPFSLKPEPFLSYYSGYLEIPSTGTYGFLTSSQDCSFLLIDGSPVVDAPGRHRPERRARTGTRKDIQLKAGEHKFEYYHAATGPEALMVAAWEVSPKDPKPQPTAIPSEAFRAESVGRVEAEGLTTRTEKLVPDFLVGIGGDVPLPDNDEALVGVKFLDTSPKALTLKAKVEWDFGDGQKAEVPDPVHVYLHPGVYTVTLTVTRGGKPFSMTNRVNIDRPTLTAKDKLHELEDYLPILATYNPKTLDAEGLCQLVLAYQWKADEILAVEPSEGDAEDASNATQPSEPPDPEKVRQEWEAKRAESLKYVTAAVEAGKVPFLEDAAARGDADLIRLARLVGPMARNQLGDSRLAGQIWLGASRKISADELKAECELQAADVAINDMLNTSAGKTFLEAATAHLGQGKADQSGPIPSRLQRVWGDYYAATGDGEAARKACLEAEKLLASTRSHIERTAWQGAHSRSTEEFLKNGEFDRAAAEIRTWEDEFPADKIGGYLTLLYARYWAGRGQYEQAVALGDQLLAVSPESPYIDQLLLLAADCEVKRGRVEQALAILHSLLQEYPGSPLVPVVRKNVAALEAGNKE